ncbi:MAG: hypothetical protein ACJAX3_000466 [Patiriisocius sp.]|jgi:hypothetical protein
MPKESIKSISAKYLLAIKWGRNIEAVRLKKRLRKNSC